MINTGWARGNVSVLLTEEEYNAPMEQATINSQQEIQMAFPNILDVSNPEGLTIVEI